MSSRSRRLESGMSSPKVDEDPSLFLIRVPGLAYWKDCEDNSVAEGLRNPRRFRMADGTRGRVVKGVDVDLSGFHGPGSKTTDVFFLGKEWHGIVRIARVMRVELIKLMGFMVDQ